VTVLAQAAQHDPPARPQLDDHERQVQEAEDRVVADEQRAAVGDPIDSEELWGCHARQRRDHAGEPVQL